MDVMDVNEAK